MFGADGYLYVSAGDGANFNLADYGQGGGSTGSPTPKNPCGDPPGGVGGTQTPPSAEGGALRSQDLRTTSDPTGLDGSILRLDPATGAAAPGNPLAASPDPNARRIIATGFRNPFRMTIRPGSDELWVGDVGWGTWEEIDRVSPSGASVANYGWPCYEGVGRQSGFDALDLSICENLYAAGATAVVTPYYAYNHGSTVVSGESCATGSSAIAGLAFYQGGGYPAQYAGALFFADNSRDCIWVMFAGANGLPDPGQRATLVAGAANPVDLEIGPGGDLYYVDFDGGTIRRISSSSGPSNQPPSAAISATPTSGSAPLSVNFSAAGSSDPDADPLSYAWDLDADGQFDDATGLTTSFTYTSAGNRNVGVLVSDGKGGTDSAFTLVSVASGGGSPTLTYLSDLDPISATNGWGPYERDTSVGGQAAGDGLPLTLNGVTYAKGLGAHAIGDLRYQIPSGSCTFNAAIGLDDEIGGDGTVIFTVFVDGVSSYASGVMTGASATALINLTLPSGASQLRLLAGDAGDNNWSDHADWADARFVCSSSGPSNQPPSAAISATPTSGSAPLSVNFSAAGSSDPDADPLSYAWDLDADGQFDDATGLTTSFTYTSAGNRNVGVLVSDGKGGTDSAFTLVSVASGGGSPTLTYLSDLDPISATNGWGPYERDTSVGGQAAGDGLPLTLNGVTYAKGLGAHAIGDLRYQIPSGSCTFNAAIGLDDEIGGDGTVIFTVFVDGVSSYASGVMTGASATALINLTLPSGASQLRLLAGDAGDNNWSDHADWADARFVCSSSGPSNQPPSAAISATPTSGSAPLSVNFSAAGSSDPDADPLSYAWDLDADGQFDDATGLTTSFTYTSAGNRNVGVLVSDGKGGTDSAFTLVSVSSPTNTAPAPVIDTPAAGLTWVVGQAITFTGHADDAQDGTLPASALSWRLVLQHCPSNCHIHVVQTWAGVADGSFSAPDHEYPSYLELELTATDAAGASTTVTRRLDPQTVALTFVSTPAGLQLAVDAASQAAPFTRTVIVGSANTISAPSPQTLSGTSYQFSAWSDGGAAGHTIVAGASATTYTATFEASGGGSPTLTYLSDLDPISATNGWGPYERDTSVGGQAAGDGLPLTLNGVTYAKGLGAHAIGDLRYQIPSGSCTFNAAIGLDDEIGGDGTVIFTVFVDGVSSYASGVMTGASATALINLSPAERRQPAAPAGRRCRRQQLVRPRRLGRRPLRVQQQRSQQPATERGDQRHPDQRQRPAQRQLQRGRLLGPRCRSAQLRLGPRRRWPVRRRHWADHQLHLHQRRQPQRGRPRLRRQGWH